jgi:hypothetical protein
MKDRIAMHQKVGFSGLMGGFMEERAYLEAVGREIMPEDHPNEAARRTFTDKIANNPQWAWHHKIRAAAMVAKYLVIGSDFADERRREDEESGGSGGGGLYGMLGGGGGRDGDQPQA